MAHLYYSVNNRDYPNLTQLFKRARRVLLLCHTIKFIESASWWSAALFVAAVVTHSTVTALNLMACLLLALLPMVIAVAIGLFYGRVTWAQVAQHCDRAFHSKQLLITAAEQLTAATAREKQHLATGYLLLQAETLAHHVLPQLKQLTPYYPSRWLTLPLMISIAAIFFLSLPGKSPIIPSTVLATTDFAVETDKNSLATHLEAVLEQQSNTLPLSITEGSDQIPPPATAEHQNSVPLSPINTPLPDSTTKHLSESSLPASHEQKTSSTAPTPLLEGMAINSDAATENSGTMAPTAKPAATEITLEIHYRDITLATPQPNSDNAATGATQELAATGEIHLKKVTATTPVSAIREHFLSHMQLSPIERKYLSDYFKKSEAQQ